MKKLIALLLALTLVLAFAACGKKDDTADTAANTETPAADDSTEETPADDAEASADTADGELEKLVVGASSTPHAEILEAARDTLKAEGYDLEVRVFDDYILPNTALADGELDANYFQHTPYLNSFNEANGTDLSAAALIHYEPFGIYAKGISSLDELAEGASIIIPADDSNETRALFLLQQEGLITLPEDADPEKGVTTLDIVDDGGYKITAVEASTVPAQLENADDGSIAVINGNYALQAGLHVADALATEDADGAAAQTYANVIAVRTEDLDSAKTKALVKALETPEIKDFIEKTYNGAVVAIF